VPDKWQALTTPAQIGYVTASSIISIEAIVCLVGRMADPLPIVSALIEGTSGGEVGGVCGQPGSSELPRFDWAR